MSSEVKKEKVQMDPKYIIELTVKLFVTCVVVAGLLGGVNAITEDKIAAINLAKTQEAMRAVVENAETAEFSEALELSAEMKDAALSGGGTLAEAYEVLEGGKVVGHALKVVASGSQGSIEMMVGLNAEGAVTGVSIVDNAETAGIGSKVMENEPNNKGVPVLDQFIGKSAADGTLSVGSSVDAITGATVSTKGVTAGVNAALAVAGLLG